MIPGFHRLNSDEAVGLHSALFLSAERFHALILSFLPVWFPWKCRPLGKSKALQLMHRQHMLFLESAEQESIPKCQCEQVLTGARQGGRGKAQHAIDLLWKELHIQQDYRLSVIL